MIAFSVNLQAQHKLVRRNIGTSISVKLPREMDEMTAEDAALRYPSVRLPLGAFTDSDRLADFSVNISATQWPDSDAELAKRFFKSSIMNMFDQVRMVDEGVREMHNRKFIYFEFESRMRASRGNSGSQDPLARYTYIMYLIGPGRTQVFSFTCLRDVQEKWQPIAHLIMNSIRVK